MIIPPETQWQTGDTLASFWNDDGLWLPDNRDPRRHGGRGLGGQWRSGLSYEVIFCVRSV